MILVKNKSIFLEIISKMKLSNLIPKDTADKFGVGTTLFLIALISFNNLLSLYNQSLENNSTQFLLAIGIWILFNVVSNMYKAIIIDTTIYSINLPNILLPDWSYCSFCEENSPPRSCFF